MAQTGLILRGKLVACIPTNKSAGAHSVAVPTGRQRPCRSSKPALERCMAQHAGNETIEAAASHAVHICKPDAVAGLAERAATAASH